MDGWHDMHGSKQIYQYHYGPLFFYFCTGLKFYILFMGHFVYSKQAGLALIDQLRSRGIVNLDLSSRLDDDNVLETHRLLIS